MPSRRDHCGESDLPERRGQRTAKGPATFALLRGAPAAKMGGALSPPAPLPCGAPLRRAGGGPARRLKLRVSKSRHPSMSPSPSERVTPVRRHLRDLQRRKSSIIPGALKPGFSWSTFPLRGRSPRRLWAVRCAMIANNLGTLHLARRGRVNHRRKEKPRRLTGVSQCVYRVAPGTRRASDARPSNAI